MDIFSVNHSCYYFIFIFSFFICSRTYFVLLCHILYFYSFYLFIYLFVRRVVCARDVSLGPSVTFVCVCVGERAPQFVRYRPTSHGMCWWMHAVVEINI